MDDPVYVQFSSYWNELFVTGLMPVAALVYMNTKIYLRICSSSKFARHFVANPEAGKAMAEFEMTSSSHSRSLNADQAPMVRSDTIETTLRETDAEPATAALNPETITRPSRQASINSRIGGPTSPARSSEAMKLCKRPHYHRKGEDDIHLCVSTDTHERRIGGATLIERRKEKSTLILVGIVVVFVVCHTYRLVVKGYELAHPENALHNHYQFCLEQKRYHVPIVLYILSYAHHLFLTINSSINIVIYCCVGREFRKFLNKVLREKTACCRRWTDFIWKKSYFKKVSLNINCIIVASNSINTTVVHNEDCWCLLRNLAASILHENDCSNTMEY